MNSNERYELGLPGIRRYFQKEIDTDSSTIIDEALVDIYQQGYTNSQSYTLKNIAMWCCKTNLKGNQTPGLFFARGIISGSRSEIINNFFRVEYTKPISGIALIKLPCPLQSCKQQFQQQTLRTEALWHLSDQMRKNWPDHTNSDAQLHRLLENTWREIKQLNQNLLSHAREIFKDTISEFHDGKLEFLSPNGTEITNEVDFPTYKTNFENELDKFSN